MNPPVSIDAVMRDGDRAAWTTVAVVLALDPAGSQALRAAAGAALAAAGIDPDALPSDRDPAAVAAQAAAPLLQAAEVLRGGGTWADLSDESLIAQGRASAQGAELFVRLALPRLAGLADALARPGARMLDVGTGTGALAIAYARALPALQVVGLDVLPRALDLARQTLERSADVADRVEFRLQDVADLDEPLSYDLVWLPAPFIPPAVLPVGMAALVRALRPGGWLMIGHGKLAGDAIDDMLARLKTVVFGGTALTDDEARAVATDAGLVGVMGLPTPDGAPALTVGRKPA